MQVYVYQAALYCEPCGEAIRERLTKEGSAPADPDDETSFDSDEFPKGPCDEGESDTPSHCDACREFLESDLTADGETYVKEHVREAWIAGKTDADSVALEVWAPFYGINPPNCAKPT